MCCLSGELGDCILYHMSRIALLGSCESIVTVYSFIVGISWAVDGEKGFLHSGPCRLMGVVIHSYSMSAAL
jgi:hypothetical protein